VSKVEKISRTFNENRRGWLQLELRIVLNELAKTSVTVSNA